MPRRSHLLAAGACGTLALSATGLRAQNSVVLEGFAARASASTDARYGGLALGAYSGPFGVRVSGALNVFRPPATGQDYGYDGGGRGCRRYDYCDAYDNGGNNSSLRVGAWTADADLIFEPLRTIPVGRALLLGFSPYAFAGVGYSAVRPVGVSDTGSASVSYGLGVRHQLLGWLGVAGEARFRRAFHDSVLSPAERRSTQYRVGLTISFGGRHAARPATTAAVPVAPPVVPPVVPAAAPATGPDALLVTPNASMASVSAHIVPRVLDLADSYVDTPYRPGGATPATGFDAPGFVQYVYGHEGVSLPRRVSQLATSGMTVSTSAGNLRPGDLVFFSNDGTAPDHVAIYAGANRIIHATASGGGVRYDVLGQGARGEWFASHLVSARRVADGAEDRARVQGDAAPHAPGELARPDQAPAPNGGGGR